MLKLSLVVLAVLVITFTAQKLPSEPFMARYGHNETWLHLVRLHDATQTKCLMRCHRGFNCGFARADSSCSLKSSPVFEPQWFYKKLTTDNWYLVNTQTGVGKTFEGKIGDSPISYNNPLDRLELSLPGNATHRLSVDLDHEEIIVGFAVSLIKDHLPLNLTFIVGNEKWTAGIVCHVVQISAQPTKFSNISGSTSDTGPYYPCQDTHGMDVILEGRYAQITIEGTAMVTINRINLHSLQLQAPAVKNPYSSGNY